MLPVYTYKHKCIQNTDIGNVQAVRHLKSTFAAQRKGWSSTINVLANVLHAALSTPGGDETRKDLRDACFGYLSIGGFRPGGLINLISGRVILKYGMSMTSFIAILLSLLVMHACMYCMYVYVPPIAPLPSWQQQE